jgi:phosphoheptose isomerase
VEYLNGKFGEIIRTLEIFEIQASASIFAAANLISETFENGGKLMTCGNGGSAADAQHFAAEFVNSFSKNLNRKALPAFSLTGDSSVTTAIANDSNFSKIFSRQIEAHGKSEDLLVVFTTSGSSVNCIDALLTAKRLKIKSITFTQKNKVSSNLSDIIIEVPSTSTQIIQECHIVAYHIIAGLVENFLFSERYKK